MDLSLLNNLKNAATFLLSQEKLLNQVQEKQEQISAIEIENDQKTEMLKIKSQYSKSGRIITGCVFLVVGLLMNMMFWGIDKDAVALLFPTLTGFPIVFGFCFALSSLIYHIKDKKEYIYLKEEFESYKDGAIALKKQSLVSEISNLERLMLDRSLEKSKNLEFLPVKYHTFDAVAMMLILVNDMRADNLKEAIYLYEEHCNHLELLSEELVKSKKLEIKAQVKNILESDL